MFPLAFALLVDAFSEALNDLYTNKDGSRKIVEIDGKKYTFSFGSSFDGIGGVLPGVHPQDEIYLLRVPVGKADINIGDLNLTPNQIQAGYRFQKIRLPNYRSGREPFMPLTKIYSEYAKFVNPDLTDEVLYDDIKSDFLQYASAFKMGKYGEYKKGDQTDDDFINSIEPVTWNFSDDFEANWASSRYRYPVYSKHSETVWTEGADNEEFKFEKRGNITMVFYNSGDSSDPLYGIVDIGPWFVEDFEYSEDKIHEWLDTPWEKRRQPTLLDFLNLQANNSQVHHNKNELHV